ALATSAETAAHSEVALLKGYCVAPAVPAPAGETPSCLSRDTACWRARHRGGRRSFSGTCRALGGLAHLRAATTDRQGHGFPRAGRQDELDPGGYCAKAR